MTAGHLEATYRALYSDLVRRLYRAGLELDAAEDAAQEAFVRYGRLEAPLDGPPINWLFRVAYCKYINVRRWLRRRPEYQAEAEAVLVADPTPSALERILEREECAAVQTALDQLEPRDRGLLHRWSRAPARNVGKPYFTNSETWYLCRARKRLRAVAQENGRAVA